MKPLMILATIPFLFIFGCGTETMGPTASGTGPLVYGTLTYSIESYLDVPSWVTENTTWREICSADSDFALAVADLLDVPPDTLDVNTSWTEIKQMFQGCPHDGQGGSSPPGGSGDPPSPPSG